MRPRRPGLPVLALLAAACAHGAGAPRIAPPAPTWPEGEPPRARFAQAFPDPSLPAPSRPWWRRAVDAVVGYEHGPSGGRWAPSRPFGVAAAGPHRVVVADPDSATVSLVDLERHAATPIACPGAPWVMPLAAAVTPDGAVWVADGGAARVKRVDAAGACAAYGAEALERPSGIAFAGGKAFVVDPPRHQVVVLGEDGAVAGRFGSRGEGAGELNFPTAIAAAADGTLLVVDALNFRIGRYSAAGEFLGAFGEAGDDPGEFVRPKAVTTDAAGAIYVSDAAADLVLVFDRDGDFQFALGGPGDGPGLLAGPSGLAVEDHRLIVADSLNGRVQVYELLGDHS